MGVFLRRHNWKTKGKAYITSVPEVATGGGSVLQPGSEEAGRQCTRFNPSGCFPLSFSFGPPLFAYFPLVVVRLDPASVVRERDVDVPVGLSDGVDPLLHPLGVPFGHRWLDRGVSALEHSLPFGQRDLVLVSWTDDAQPAAKFLPGG